MISSERRTPSDARAPPLLYTRGRHSYILITSCVFFQLLAEFRRSNIDERADALAQGFAVQARHPILGNDIVDIAPRGDHPGTGLELSDDAREPTMSGLRRRRQSDDRLATARARRAAHKIKLAANAAENRRANRVRAHLARNVHLKCRIDGDHVVVLRDDEWVVHVIARMELDHCIILHEIIKALRTK